MIFTGNELSVKRNFFTQTGNYGFAATVNVGTTTGAYHFGLSGAGGTLDFRLESGYLYWGNQAVHAYQSYADFVIEGQFTSGQANIVKDGAALVYGMPKSTGYFDYFYFNRASADMPGQFAVEISGNNTPLYTIQQQGYLISSGQNAVTGWFSNQSQFPIRVFDSAIQASAIYDFGKLTNVPANGSGSFAYTGDYSTIDFSQPILTTFATNFGGVGILFTITDVRTLNRFVQLTSPTTFDFNNTGILNQNIAWQNYSGGFVVGNFNTSLAIQLRYMTGYETFTGAWNVFTGGSPTALVALSSSSGLFSGSGNFAPNSFINFQVSYSGVSGNQAQLVISGQNVLNPVNQTLTFNA